MAATQVKPFKQGSVNSKTGKKNNVTINLKDLNLDRDGDGQVDETEAALLAKLKAMDVDGDGEIGLAELCSLASGLEDSRQKYKDMRRIVFGVIFLAVCSCVVCFFAAWAANEASKDSKPENNGELRTIDGTMISTSNFERSIEMSELATLTPESLDKMTKLRYTLGSVTEFYTVVGYRLDAISDSQRSVTFFTARGSIILASVHNQQGTAEVRHADGRTEVISTASTTVVAGRRRHLLASTTPATTAAATTSGDTVTTVATAASSCPAGSVSAFAKPGLDKHTLCAIGSEVCCTEGDTSAFTLTSCGTGTASCKVSATPAAVLDAVYPGMIAPAAGSVKIYWVDVSGIPYLETEVLETTFPWQCQATEPSYFCLYGYSATQLTFSCPPTYVNPVNASKIPWLGNYTECNSFGPHLCCKEDMSTMLTSLTSCAVDGSFCKMGAAAMSNLDNIYSGLTAPQVGYVNIYKLSTGTGAPTLETTVLRQSNPAQCEGYMYQYLCIFGYYQAPSAVTPAAIGEYKMRDEGDPHTATWMAFAAKEYVWGTAQMAGVATDLATIAKTIAKYEPVNMLVSPGDRSVAESHNLHSTANINLIDFDIDDLWMRDTGPVFVTDHQGGMRAVQFNFNGWGNKQVHAYDKLVAGKVAEYAGVPLEVSTLTLEGGGIEVDGHGTAIMTESCILNENRNPGVTKEMAEVELKRALNLTKILWVDGIAGRDITDGHTDFYARFVRPGVVVVAIEQDPTSYDYKVTHDIRDKLTGAIDAQGNVLEVHSIDGPGANIRATWTSTFAAGYINYYIAAGAIISPNFGDALADAAALAKLTELYPGYVIEQIPIDSIANGGGGIHCSTQQQPIP